MHAKGVNTSKFKTDKDVFVPVDEKESLATIMASVKHANFVRVTLCSLVVFGSVESWVDLCLRKAF